MRDLFRLPLPPTTNHAYATRILGKRSIMYKTKECRAWEEECAWLLKKAWKGKPLTGPVYVGISIFLKYDRDIDNVKLLLDLLQNNGVFPNDKQVHHLNVLKYKSADPHVELEIRLIELLGIDRVVIDETVRTL